MNKYALHQSLHRALLAAVIGSLLAGGSVTAQASTITVNATSDAPAGALPGACTLRSAIASANAGAALDACDAGTAGADEIVFAPGLANSTITLSEGRMEITDALTITGPVPGDPAGMTIDGNGQSQIFLVSSATASDPFDVRLDNIILTGGTGYTGGGLRVWRADVTLTNSTVSGNTAGLIGGGLYVYGSDLALINSKVSGNGAQSTSGGLWVSSSDVTLINSTVSGNAAFNSGGGLYLIDSDVTLINSTVSGNSTGDSGGGLIVSGGDATLTHSTVAYNTARNAKSADGIHLISSSLTLNNSLVVQADAGQTACNYAANEHSNSLVTDSSCTGIAALPAVINLGPLADNGGLTQTHALNAGSAAIDAAGDCVAQFGITEDQRGAPRPIDGNGSGTAECDIGAYEFQDMLFRDRFEQP